MASAPLNWIAKIGGDVLTTAAQTISAAINELKSTITNLSGADVSYDNTTSQLSATDVQGAIDEVKSDISSLTGSDIDYDNTSSGLLATDVQDAVDEVNTKKMSYTDNAILGAKNLLPNNATSRTVNGVTFTINSNGSITVNGTATAAANLTISAVSLNVGSYISSGCPVGGKVPSGTDDTFAVEVYNRTDNTRIGWDIGSGFLFSLVSDKEITITISIRTGYVANNLTFYPMIRLATDTDDTYVPYAKTNRELTESLKVVGNVLTVATSNDIEWNYADARANDTVVGFKGFVQLKRDATASENSWITIGTISKTPTWWSQNTSTKLVGTGTAGDSAYQITASGEVKFNIRAGMKTGDQYLIAGTNIL